VKKKKELKFTPDLGLNDETESVNAPSGRKNEK
jgi:hypothetical protein